MDRLAAAGVPCQRPCRRAAAPDVIDIGEPGRADPRPAPDLAAGPAPRLRSRRPSALPASSATSAGSWAGRRPRSIGFDHPAAHRAFQWSAEEGLGRDRDPRAGRDGSGSVGDSSRLAAAARAARGGAPGSPPRRDPQRRERPQRARRRRRRVDQRPARPRRRALVGRRQRARGRGRLRRPRRAGPARGDRRRPDGLRGGPAARARRGGRPRSSWSPSASRRASRSAPTSPGSTPTTPT